MVSVPAMLNMFKELGTPANKKVEVAMPYAGDHVMGSYIKSKDLLDVQQSIEKFMQHTLKMQKLTIICVINVTVQIKILVRFMSYSKNFCKSRHTLWFQNSYTY